MKKMKFLLKLVQALSMTAAFGIYCIVVVISTLLLGTASSELGIALVQVLIAVPLIVAEEIPIRAVIRSVEAHCVLFYWHPHEISFELACGPFMPAYVAILLGVNGKIISILLNLFMALMIIGLIVRIVAAVFLTRLLPRYNTLAG